MKRRGEASIATLVTLLLALAVTGCNGDDGMEIGDAAATEQELLARVSAALRTRPAQRAIDAVAYVDLAGARDQLGLPEDAPASDRGRRRLLLSFATRPLFRFSTFAAPRPSLGSLGEVLDTRRLVAAAGSNFAFAGPLSDQVGPEDAVVLRTDQPFDEIAEALRKLGYEENAGGLLRAPEPIDPDETRSGIDPRRRIAFPVAGAGNGGVVVFAGSGRAARAALEGAEHTLTPAARLVAELPGVSRAAAGRGLLYGRCVRALGLGEDANPREGVLVVVVAEEAEGERHRFSEHVQPTTFFEGARGKTASEGEIEFTRAIAEGERAEVRFISPDELNATRLGIESVQRPYECPTTTG